MLLPWIQGGAKVFLDMSYCADTQLIVAASADRHVRLYDPRITGTEGDTPSSSWPCVAASSFTFWLQHLVSFFFKEGTSSPAIFATISVQTSEL